MSQQLKLHLFDEWEKNYKGEPNPMIPKVGRGPEGERCKTCRFLYGKTFSKTYYKCKWRGDTNGAGTDHRVNWNACAKYEREG